MAKDILLSDNESKILSIIRNKWVQSGIAGIPFVGGSLQSFLSNVLQEVDKKAWNDYWNSVENRLIELDSGKINIDYFSSDDFVRRLRILHAEVVAGADSTKLQYLREYLVGCVSNLDIDTSWKDIVLEYLKKMTGTHLLILRIFYEKQNNLSLNDRFALPQRVSNSPIVAKDIAKELKEIDRILVEMVIADLCSHGVLDVWLGSPQEPKGWSITDSGLRMMKFLVEPWE